MSTSAKDELNAAVDELSSLSVKVNEELDETLNEQIKLNVSLTTATYSITYTVVLRDTVFGNFIKKGRESP